VERRRPGSEQLAARIARCGATVPLASQVTATPSPAAASAWPGPGHGRPGYLVASPPVHSNVSLASEVSGSQTGSQRPQAWGYIRPYPATITSAERHVRRHPASPSHTSKVPPKQ
jgi:hypothetical protein